VIPPEFPEWDSMTQGLILGSFFYGYICTQLPGGWLSRKYGGKSVYLCGVFGNLTTILRMIINFCRRSSIHFSHASVGTYGQCRTHVHTIHRRIVSSQCEYFRIWSKTILLISGCHISSHSCYLVTLGTA
jgi:MFS family permease